MPSPGKTGKKAARRPRAAGQPAEVPQRVVRRERRRERSREEIVDATRRVLLRKGVAGTTLDAVAKEVGLTKAALYYYYPSKDALFFELVYGMIERQSHAVHDAVEETTTGAEALRAIIRELVQSYSSNIDDFRLAYLFGQVAGPGTVHLAAEQLERIRPLNDLAYAGAAERLATDWKRKRGRADVNPRLMAFLANIAAVGLLTFKGMVESAGDPLLYSDDELIEGLSRIFEAAARP